ncbi:MAG: N-acetylmuramoyl-L-alanine amidase [Spirochaetales bacterium]
MRRVTVGLLLLVGSLLFATEYGIDIRELLSATGATLEWDEFSRTGVLWGEEASIGFAPGEELAVADFDQVIQIDPVVYSRGNLFLPETTYETLRERLGVNPDQLRLRPIKAIVIDAGHGGKDPGANRTLSINGVETTVREKDLVLDMAVRVKAELERLLNGPEIHLSRDTDVFLELGERTEFAHSLREDPLDNILFVSLHVNASRTPWTDARGIEIYYLPPNQRRQVLEDRDEEHFDPAVLAILNDVKEEEYTLESKLVGESVLNAIAERLPATPIERGINVANFFVVREARMPSILVETGFVNNREEVLQLVTPTYRQQLSEAIALGIARYVRDFETVQ